LSLKKHFYVSIISKSIWEGEGSHLGLNAFVPFAFFIKPIQKSYDLNLRILSKIIFLYLNTVDWELKMMASCLQILKLLRANYCPVSGPWTCRLKYTKYNKNNMIL